MHLQRIKLQEFRNYTELELLPQERLNILVGENAQGKSNLLEAIYLLATTRSLRANRESELVRHGAESGTVHASLVREREGDIELEVSVLPTDKKIVRINGAKRARVIELLGQLNAVHFCSADIMLVSEDPSLRRRYLNVEISQISPKYCFDLASYKKALEQRNRLLRDLRDRPCSNTGLEAWNEQLIQHGAPVLEKRRFFIDRLAPLANAVHQELTDGHEQLTLSYLPSVPVPDADVKAIAESFRAELARVESEEMRRGVTVIGPQRDDIQFLINGKDARSYGSQGQQRTLVLSLKLAQFRMMSEYVGEAPIMLFDDVMSDLDDRRRCQLLGMIHQRCQTFVTCTSLRDFPQAVLAEARIYQVVDGHITEFCQETTGSIEAEGHGA